MAWIDDRIWAHPKVMPLTDRAFRAYISGIAYSSGFNTAGVLERAHQKAVGSDARIRRELVAAELWDDVDGATVHIHDWDEHNGARDARKAADRERKRRAYWQERGQEPPQETPRRNKRRNGGETTGDSAESPRARDRGRPPDDGVTNEENPRAVTALRPDDDHEPETNSPDDFTIEDWNSYSNGLLKDIR